MTDTPLRHRLGPKTVLVLLQADITGLSVDAIVNAANQRMLGGGGVDGAIHRAAGPQLLTACEATPEVRPGLRCPTGEARITPGFALPAAHVIHTVGPVYGSHSDPDGALAAAYRNSLLLATAEGLQTVAFPAISCGVYRFPLERAARIAIETCSEHGQTLREITFALFGEATLAAWRLAAEELLDEPAR